MGTETKKFTTQEQITTQFPSSGFEKLV